MSHDKGTDRGARLMPSIELKMNVKQIAAVSMAAHAEDMTLNAYVNSILQDAASRDIERYELSAQSNDEEQEKASD